jgi:hypothetical protein
MVFVGFYLLVAFTHKKQHRYTYPFTAWPMFSSVCAERPYREHRPWTTLASNWVIDADPPLAPAVEDYLWRTYHPLAWGPYADCCKTLTHIRKNLEQTYHTTIRRMTLARATFQVQPFPRNEVRPQQAVLNCVWAGGEFRGLETKAGWDRERRRHYLEVKPHGLEAPRYQVGFHLHGTGDWQPLDVEQAGNRFYFDKKQPGRYLLSVHVTDPALGSEPLPFGGELVD